MAKALPVFVLEKATELGQSISDIGTLVEALEPTADVSQLRRAELELQMATETLLDARYVLAERIKAAGQLRMNQSVGRG